MVPFTKNRFHITGTGSGTPATAISEIREFTRWTSRAGASGWISRNPWGVGGKYAYNDDQETPNTIITRLDYGDKELVFEVRGLQTGHEGGVAHDNPNCVGNLFYGDQGWMSLDEEGCRIYKGDNEAKLVQEIKYQEGPDERDGPIWKTFLLCPNRKYQDLHAEVDIGRISADLCHLANISYRLGGRLLT